MIQELVPLVASASGRKVRFEGSFEAAAVVAVASEVAPILGLADLFVDSLYQCATADRD